MMKKLLSFVLALSMVLSLTTLYFAAETDLPPPEETIIDSGSPEADPIPSAALSSVDAPIPDGVYVIDSDSGLTLEHADKYDPGELVVIRDNDGESINNPVYSGMWRVQHVGNGYYTIRPMNCTVLALCYDSLEDININLDDIGYANNSSVPAKAKWRFVSIGDQYILSPYMDSSMAISLDPGSGIYIDLYDDNLSEQYFYFYPVYCGSDYEERIFTYDKNTGEMITSEDKIVVYAGESFTLDEIGVVVTVATEGDIGGAFLSWIESAVEDVFTTDSYYGQTCFNALNPGDAIAYFEFPTDDMWLLHGVNFEVQLLEGTQYLKNLRLNNAYLDVLSPSSQAYSELGIEYYFGRTSSHWIFDFVGDGYYTIRPKACTESVYLCGDIANDEVELIYSSATNAANYSGTLWKVVRTQSGRFLLTTMALEAQGQCLSAEYPYPNPEEPNNAVMRPYTEDDSLEDEWGIRCTTSRSDQGDETKWCWAACIQMMQKKYTETITNVVDIVLAIYFPGQAESDVNPDELKNRGGYEEGMLLAIETFTPVSGVEVTRPILDEKMLCHALDSGNLIMRIITYDDGIRHATLIYDYYLVGDTPIFFYWDPQYGLTEPYLWYYWELVDFGTVNNKVWTDSVFLDIGPSYSY